MRIVQAVGPDPIPIGKQGENAATQVQFPVVESWTASFGVGVFQLLVRRPTEPTPYAVTITSNTQNVLWVVSSEEVAIPGLGKCELRYVVNNTIAKSQTFLTETKKSIEEPWRGWVTQVLIAGAEATSAAANAASSAAAASASETAAESAKDAAQAAASSVGDVRNLSEWIIENEYRENDASRTWVNGALDEQGRNANSSIRIRSNGYLRIKAKTGLKLTVPENLIVTMWKYDTAATTYYEGNIVDIKSGLYYFDEEKYLRFTAIRRDGTATDPSEGDNISIVLLSRYDVYPSYPLGLHVPPESDGILNIIRRARQYTDIRWTPAVDLPRVCRMAGEDNPIFEGVFKAGTEYIGIPYSSAKGTKIENYGYTRMIPGIHISFDSFVTAIENAGTFVSTESEYNETNRLSTLYGSTCCGMVSYALGMTWHSTEAFNQMVGSELPTRGDVNSEFDINLLSLADLLIASTHTAIVTDLVKDSNGNTVFVEVSEDTIIGDMLNNTPEGDQYGGHAIRKGWSIADFKDHFNGFSVCYYPSAGTVAYSPSKYVNVGDELNMRPSSNMACMPYMGEGFEYKNGYIYNSDILVNTSEYGYLQVYKDGELYNTYEIPANATKITTNFTGQGNYYAFLCNMSGTEITNRSAKCHWAVI